MCPFIHHPSSYLLPSPILGTNKGRTLRVVENTRTAVRREMAIQALGNPEQTKDRKRECTPVDEGARTLVLEDSEQCPSNRNRTGEVTLGAGECVGRCSRFEEEQAEEDEDFRPDTRAVRESVDTKCLEEGEDNKDCRPAVV